MIGGAVVDQHDADEIGANGYANDAIGAVRLAQQFSGETLSSPSADPAEEDTHHAPEI
jgi:5-methyltetrahydrofolate--homocysteine methyltransferase